MNVDIEESNEKEEACRIGLKGYKSHTHYCDPADT